MVKAEDETDPASLSLTFSSDSSSGTWRPRLVPAMLLQQPGAVWHGDLGVAKSGGGRLASLASRYDSG